MLNKNLQFKGEMFFSPIFSFLLRFVKKNNNFEIENNLFTLYICKI